jgi:pimeloyl-ACP methyl ester carboxylesterase
VFEARGTSEQLVVLLHAYTSNPEELGYLRNTVIVNMPNADIMVPKLPVSAFSFADPVDIVERLLKQIDEYWCVRKYTGIILVGHSIGALLARKIYVCACGENSEAPFESGITNKSPREWAGRVERIILLAGMNRGWSITHHLSLLWTTVWRLGTIIGNLLMPLFGRRPLIFTVRRGAPFITNLRIQWLSMRNKVSEGIKSAGNAMAIQLLGSVDDMVSPEDNIDLVTIGDFRYLDVPASGHASIIVMDGSAAGEDRRRVFVRALTASTTELETEKVLPQDFLFPERREEVTDVIFVIHGIRDLGYWTHKIARRVKDLGKKYGKVFATETSGYGYFPMLPFLFPAQRRAKMEWLMDQYVENMAIYPKACFSFVGHSNGTYLLARALKDYPCCRFKHVVFAGSVVRKDYDWEEFFKTEQIQAVLNYVATSDWVVAFFPKALQIFRSVDLGSAGHDGFAFNSATSSFHQIEYVRGGHSAALKEENWEAIARFVVQGVRQDPPLPIYKKRQSKFVALPARIALLLWIVILLLVGWIGYMIIGSGWAEWQKAVIFIVYLWSILKILTRF